MVKEMDDKTKFAIAKHVPLADQIKYVISEGWDSQYRKKHLKYGSVMEHLMNRLTEPYMPKKEYNGVPVPAATTGNTSALYYATQSAGVLLPAVTTSILSQLVALGAPQLPPNQRIVTQAELLQASEVAEGEPIPAAAPSVDVDLKNNRKFALILSFSDSLLAPVSFTDAVVPYVQGQLEAAANNATDAFIVNLMESGGTAAASIAAALSAFVGDLRTACWIGRPDTLASLQDAANPNIGPRGGVYKTLPAISSLAVPAGKLILQDATRIAVFDGPQMVDRSQEASIIMDTAPTIDMSATLHTFQQSMTALRIIKYADAKVIAAPQIITLAS